jgi:DNA-binding PadR family transcriptional regulator
VVSGKVRKYYAISAEGHRVLEETRDKIAELVHEVVEGRGPRHLVAPNDSDESS